MRRLTVILFLFLSSCQSEDVQPNESIEEVPQDDCNCGVITSIEFISGAGYAYYQFKARNVCSNNNSVISIPMDGITYYVGDYICLENTW